jgi:hypothetical protein
VRGCWWYLYAGSFASSTLGTRRRVVPGVVVGVGRVQGRGGAVAFVTGPGVRAPDTPPPAHTRHTRAYRTLRLLVCVAHVCVPVCAQGGVNVAIVGGTGFLGAQPQSRIVSTPNPMAGAATPLGTPGGTPLVRGGTGAAARVHGRSRWGVPAFTATPHPPRTHTIPHRACLSPRPPSPLLACLQQPLRCTTTHAPSTRAHACMHEDPPCSCMRAEVCGVFRRTTLSW